MKYAMKNTHDSEKKQVIFYDSDRKVKTKRIYENENDLELLKKTIDAWFIKIISPVECFAMRLFDYPEIEFKEWLKGA